MGRLRSAGVRLPLVGERKVRTLKGKIPRESGGAAGQPVVTDSVTENNRLTPA